VAPPLLYGARSLSLGPQPRAVLGATPPTPLSSIPPPYFLMLTLLIILITPPAAAGLNYRAVLETAADVAKSLLHLHAHDVLHSDLKWVGRGMPIRGLRILVQSELSSEFRLFWSARQATRTACCTRTSSEQAAPSILRYWATIYV
jgi:hypothetical protein